MDEVSRFGVSMDRDLLRRFDEHIQMKGYSNRSEALRDLVRQMISEEEQESEDMIFGVIMYVYDHHRRDLDAELTGYQHRHTDSIVFSNHIHIDHDLCLEIVVVKNQSRIIREIADNIFSRKGVKLGKCILALPTVAG